MPNTHETLAGLFSAIADAIRSKTGGTAAICADTFPAEIEAISGGERCPRANANAALDFSEMLAAGLSWSGTAIPEE